MKVIKEFLKKSNLLKKVYEEYKSRILNRKLNKVWKEHISTHELRVTHSLNSKDRPQFVFIIVIDCLRYDRLSHTYESKVVAPFLSQMVAKGNGSLNHYSSSSWTYPSVGSILSGKYPKNHKGRMKALKERHFNLREKSLPHKIPKEVPLLADFMHFSGYSTFAHSEIETANFVLKGRFEKFRSSNNGVKYVMEKTLSSVKSYKQRNDSAVGYLHLGDLHEPLSIFDEVEYRPFGDIADLLNIKGWNYAQGEGLDSKEFDEYKANKLKLYDTALHFVDEQIASFVEKLKELGVYDNSLIVITGDHGEEFWDHVDYEKSERNDPRGIYGVGHGHTLFQELIRLPFIIIQGSKKSPVFSPITSHVDILPTVLDQCGVITEEKFDGESLFNKNKKRYIFAEELAYGDEMKAIISTDRKMIYYPCEDYFVEMISGSTVPEEYKRVELDDDLVKKLKAFSSMKQENQSDAHIEIDKKLKKRLEKLGYI